MSQIRLTLAAAVAVAVLAAAGCSSHKAPAHTTAAGHTAARSSSAPASNPATKAPAGLTGKWSGRYSGAYKGTFVLRWRQNGSRLTGRITISNPATTLPIHGLVTGGSIRFGTVGSTAITYSGAVSGDSMSGHWSYHGGSGGGGPWSATKSS